MFLVAPITAPSTEMLDKYLNRIQISYLGKLYLLMSISIMFKYLSSISVLGAVIGATRNKKMGKT